MPRYENLSWGELRKFTTTGSIILLVVASLVCGSGSIKMNGMKKNRGVDRRSTGSMMNEDTTDTNEGSLMHKQVGDNAIVAQMMERLERLEARCNGIVGQEKQNWGRGGHRLKRDVQAAKELTDLWNS